VPVRLTGWAKTNCRTGPVQNGLNPNSATLSRGTLCSERSCRWERDGWEGIRWHSVRWRWIGFANAIRWSLYQKNWVLIDVYATKWRQQLEPLEDDGIPSPDTREFTLTKEICQLKRLLGENTQEIDFFKGALQKVEARRRNSESAGARASTTKSGSDVNAR